MAIRPVFIPKFEEGRLVEEVLFDFPWASGFAEIQKKMNILALHKKAKENGLNRVLEISTKSDKRVGRHLMHIPGYPPTYSDNIRPFVPGHPPSFDALP